MDPKMVDVEFIIGVMMVADDGMPSAVWREFKRLDGKGSQTAADILKDWG